LASSPAAPEVLDYQQLTSDGRTKSGFTASGLPFALATDGSRVYFMEGGGGGFGLAQVSTAGGEVAAIPQPFPQGQIFDISMDRSEFLLGAFISTETEAPLTILPLPAGPLRRVGDVLAHDATWSPDGKRIAYIEGRDLYVTGHDGAERRKLATLAGVAYWPRWSPDGNVLRLTVLDPKTSSPSLWEVSVDGARSRPLFAGWNDPPAECCGSWTADGRDFVFQSTRNGKTHIWAVPERRGPFRMSTSEPTQVTSGPMMFLAPLASHDGRRLFALGVQPRGELVRYDAASKHFVPFLSGISADAIDFSGDGEWVAYVAVPEGTLWRSRADGRDRVRLTSPPMTAALPRWSPDGQQIAFFAKAPGRPWKIHFVSRGGGSPQQAIPGESHESDPSWSPDGRSLAFAGAPWTEGYAPASTAIHLLHLGTRTVSTLPGSEGLFSPRWSPDGRYIAALPADQHGLRLFDFRTRQWTDLGNLNVNYPSWSRDGRYIYFDVVSATEPEFLRIRVADRKVERIVSLKGFRRASGALAMWAGIAPDDSPLLLRDIGTQEIYALDWHAP
jgi:Tol biopolymer transport system component